MGVATGKKIEFLHKKSRYIFPEDSKIFMNGNKLLVEIANKKTRSISRYLLEKSNIDLCDYIDFRVGLPITHFGSQIVKEYQAITDFLAKNPKLDFLHFEYATSHDLTLCAFFKSENLIRAGNLIKEVNRELPYLLNIFKRPLIHLKEAEIIQPVDAVKRVNYATVRHLFRHPENWKNIKNDNVVPERLLTRVYDDDYSIYENIVFRDLIDKLLVFFRTNIYHLTEIFDTFKEWVQIDAINRFNHPNYYLAIGKLYLGFTKMESTAELSNMLESLKKLYKQIKENLHRAVYTRNSFVKPLSTDIKRTNILAMHKDYKHVYSLHKQFKRQIVETQEHGDFSMQQKSQTAYENFCKMLILFSASNFNFSKNSGDIVCKNGKLNAKLEYKDWVLTLSDEYNPILDINVIIASMVKGNKKLKYLFIPMAYNINLDRKKQYENIVERLYYSKSVYDKYIFLDPFYFAGNIPLYGYSIKHLVEERDLFYSILPVSIFEVSSFRRIQKLLFEIMVFSDEEYGTCAFCGEKLAKEKDGRYLCHKCRTAVKIISCEHCKKDYKATFFDIIISKKSYKKEKEDEFLNDLPEFYQQEKRHSFRNVTDINENGFVCPYCGKENK